MSKDSKKNLVGQPIFKQIIKMLPREQFDILVHQLGSDRYYKTFFSWEQLIVTLFGIFSRCDSMGEVCDSMQALAGKLNYLGPVQKHGRRRSAGSGQRTFQIVLFCVD